jgi:hypothetical protein
MMPASSCFSRPAAADAGMGRSLDIGRAVGRRKEAAPSIVVRQVSETALPTIAIKSAHSDLPAGLRRAKTKIADWSHKL